MRRPLFNNVVSGVSVGALLLAAGCAKTRDPAPDDMDGLVSYLYAHWEDPERLAEGMENLAPWLDDEGSTDRAREGYILTDLTEEQVAGVDYPDVDLTEHLGVATGATSPHAIEAHAALLVLEDQMWNNPSGYNRYDREVREGHAERFTSGQDALVRTMNDIDKKGAFGVDIPYAMHKDYAWVTLDDGRLGIVGRSWVPERSCAEGGKNCLEQSFSIDLFQELSSGGTVRLTASWNDLTTVVDSLLSEDALVKMMVDGQIDIFENTDTFIAEGVVE